MRILFYAKSPDATEVYRVQIPGKYLARKPGIEVRMTYAEKHPKFPDSGVKNHDIQWADAIIFQRPATELVLNVLKIIKNNHPDKIILLDYDDDYYSVPTWNPGYTFIRVNEKFWPQFPALVDGVITSTEPLADVFRQKTDKPITVIPNGFDFEEFDQIESAPDLFIENPGYDKKANKSYRNYSLNLNEFRAVQEGRHLITWAGSRFHFMDLEYIAEDVKKIIKERSDVNFMFVSYLQANVLKDAPPNRIYSTAGMSPVSRFYGLLKALDSDIMLAPLDPCQFNRSKCVVGGTRVVTRNGIFEIKDLVPHRINDAITPIETSVWVDQDQNWKAAKASYFALNQATIKLQTSFGYEIEGTEDHRIQNKDGDWVKLSDFRLGDEIKLSPFEFPEVPYQMTQWPFMTSRVELNFPDFEALNCAKLIINEDWGRLLGYILGDGYMNGVNRVQISCTSDHTDVIEDVERLFHSIGLRSFRSQKKPKKTAKGVDIVVTSTHLMRWLKHHNLIGPKGKVFRIPEFIMKSPKSVICEFLRGLFESDGYTVEHDQCLVGLTSKSRELLQDVQFLLLGFGIKSKIVSKKIKLQQWLEPRHYWELQLRSKSSRIFHEKINFISCKKREKLAVRTKSKPSNRTDDWDWSDSVVSIQKSVADVFDITVPGPNYYLANGFVSHNSNLKILEMMALKAFPVCSRWDAYEDDLDPELNDDTTHGLLVGYERGDWYRAMNEALERSRDKSFKAVNDAYVRATHDASLRSDLYISFIESLKK
jgi:intein/homing endonuclease